MSGEKENSGSGGGGTCHVWSGLRASSMALGDLYSVHVMYKHQLQEPMITNIELYVA